MVIALLILSVWLRLSCLSDKSLVLPKANLGGSFTAPAFIEKETKYEFRDGKEVY